MQSRSPVSFAVGLATVLAATAFAGTAYGSGFGLLEQSARSLGRAHSGGAALVDDPSAIFYNPAGLTLLTRPEFMASASYIKLEANFTKDIAVDAAGRPLSGPEDGGANKPGYVPAIFFGAPFNDRWAWGVGLYAPFGLNTDYHSDSIMRYQAIYSGVAVVNLTPTIAYKINDVYSIGLGLDVQRASVKLTNDIDYGAVCFGSVDPVTCAGMGLVPQSHDGFVSVDGSSTDYGWNIGVLANYGATRVGFTYRSAIDHDIDGNARFEAVPAVFAAQGLFQSGGAKATLKTPDAASLSFAHDLNPKWTISGDVTWTHWARFKEIRIDFDNPKQPPTIKPENWQNTWRFSAGVDYHYNSAWTLRGGLAFDQTAIQDKFRDPRLPGDNRRWVALGASWHINGDATLDIGYAHLFLSDNIPIDQVGTTGDHIKGSYDVATEIASIGLRYAF